MSRVVASWGRSALFLVVSILAACGDGPTEPGDRLEVGPTELVFALPGDSAVIRVMKDGAPLSGATFTVAREERDVSVLPVIVRDALSRGVVRVAGPGRADVTVRAGSATATVTVRVAPTAPSVFGLRTALGEVGPDTVTLWGAHLDRVARVGAVRVGGVGVDVLQQDARSVRFLAPSVQATTCAGAAPGGAVEVAGAVVAAGLEAPMARAGEVRLARGDYRLLSEAEASCIRLPARDAEYVLAYVDLRQEAAGRGAWAGFPGAPYTVGVRDRTVPSTAAPRAVAWLEAAFPEGRAPVPVTDGRTATCSDDDFSDVTFWCRSKPWVEGDGMWVRLPGSPGREVVRATVWKVFGGLFPVAVIDGHDSERLRAFKTSIEQAMPHVLSVSVPLLRSIFGDVVPFTSPGSGQVLTLIGDFEHSSVGAGCCPPGIGPWAVLTLGSWHPPFESESFYLFTHEFAHVWQQRWFYDTRPAGGAAQTHVVWGLEGGADLIAFEAVRRYAGIPWRANRTRASFTDGANRDATWLREMSAKGDIALGYEHGSSFLRDVVARAVAAGAPLDDAYRSVALGALEDWHGYDVDGVRREGLTRRVRTHLGVDWTPGDALLLYTLSQGADDRTGRTALQNPFFARVGEEPVGEGFGSVRVRGGSGAGVTVQRGATSTGLVYLVDPGSGSSFETTSGDGGVRWAIARVR